MSLINGDFTNLKMSTNLKLKLWTWPCYLPDCSLFWNVPPRNETDSAPYSNYFKKTSVQTYIQSILYTHVYIISKNVHHLYISIY